MPEGNSLEGILSLVWARGRQKHRSQDGHMTIAVTWANPIVLVEARSSKGKLEETRIAC